MYSKLLLMSGKHLNQAKLTLKFCLILSSDTDYFIFVSITFFLPQIICLFLSFLGFFFFFFCNVLKDESDPCVVKKII